MLDSGAFAEFSEPLSLCSLPRDAFDMDASA